MDKTDDYRRKQREANTKVLIRVFIYKTTTYEKTRIKKWVSILFSNGLFLAALRKSEMMILLSRKPTKEDELSCLTSLESWTGPTNWKVTASRDSTSTHSQ